MRRQVTGVVLTLGVLCLAAAGCAPALKDVKPRLEAGASGNVWFASAGSLERSADGRRFVPAGPVVVSGDLAFPAGPGPFPAVVLAHGCGGVGSTELGWASVLREWGYATFVLDSFRGRGLIEVCTHARTLSAIQRIADAYGALRILATHPRIDPRRVALMGFSHGGILSLNAATVWARDTYAPDGQPRFRAFLPFYPYCNTVYPERDRVAAPVRVHMGEADDWLPVGPCVRLVESLRASGHDASITVYPGAHHAFDNPALGYVRRADVDNPSACELTVPSVLGPLPDARVIDACLRKGATMAGNPQALAQARRNVRAQLAELLR